MVIHMDRHVTSTMAGARVSWETHIALKRIAEERGTTVNAMLKGMIERRVQEIREEEGW
jgi:hypothetical protein